MPENAMWKCIAVLSTLFVPLQAFGEPAFFSGNELHRACEAADGQQNVATGYVLGVLDEEHDLIPLPDGKTRSVASCAPRSVRASQVRDIVCKYLRDNPQDRHLTAASLTIHALTVAFPCR
jgi:hypothetical protein